MVLDWENTCAHLLLSHIAVLTFHLIFSTTLRINRDPTEFNQNTLSVTQVLLQSNCTHLAQSTRVFSPLTLSNPPPVTFAPRSGSERSIPKISSPKISSCAYTTLHTQKSFCCRSRLSGSRFGDLSALPLSSPGESESAFPLPLSKRSIDRFWDFGFLQGCSGQMVIGPSWVV